MMAERCSWCGTDPLYIDYHDTEWGVPVRDGRDLWEKLVLEGFQAGLSWITILRKRQSFRAAFDNFDPYRIARYDQSDVTRLLGDAGIVRHRGKIEATIGNARAFIALEEREGFASFIWSHVDGDPQQNAPRTMADVPAETPVSRQLSKDLKKAGFKFCGPTIVYAFMQASGMVNDHVRDCYRAEAIRELSEV